MVGGWSSRDVRDATSEDCLDLVEAGDVEAVLCGRVRVVMDANEQRRSGAGEYRGAANLARRVHDDWAA